MTFLEKLRVLQRLHYLIKVKGTGPRDQLARKLNISKASLSRYIGILEGLGADVHFCSSRNSYCYRQSFVLNLEGLIF